jgi:hypothetical protein
MREALEYRKETKYMADRLSQKTPQFSVDMYKREDITTE